MTGGAGRESEANRERLDYDNRRLKTGHEPPAGPPRIDCASANVSAPGASSPSLACTRRRCSGVIVARAMRSNAAAKSGRRASATDVSKRLDLAMRLLIGDGEHPKI